MNRQLLIDSTRSFDTGDVLLYNGYPEMAIGYLKDRKDPVGRLNYGIACRQTSRLHEAQDIVLALCKTEDLSPHVFGSALNTLGMLHTDFGRFLQAEAAFACAFDADPQQQYALNLGYAKLRLQKFSEGWKYYESGRFGLSWRPLDGTKPWQGEPGSVFCVSEGGYGDAFLFSRWLPDAKKRADWLDLALWGQLDCTGMWQSDEAGFRALWHDGNPYWVSDGRINYDYTTSLMSLPAVLGLDSLSAIPDYQKPVLDGNFDRKLTPNGGIGICWQAEETGVIRRHRSISLEELAPLADCRKQFYSLCHNKPVPSWITSFSICNWADTMSILLGLDAVVTVDTAVAHLAGLMEVPTILLLPMRSDWKWFTDIDYSPWWKTVKLVRNTNPLSWRPAIEELIEVLRVL